MADVVVFDVGCPHNQGVRQTAAHTADPLLQQRQPGVEDDVGCADCWGGNKLPLDAPFLLVHHAVPMPMTNKVCL